MTHKHTHMSGRFTVTGGQEEAATDQILAECDRFSTTEVDANIRARCLREPGFEAVFGDKGPRDDCGLSFRKSVFEVLDGETIALSPLRYRNERHQLAGETVAAVAAIREVDTGKVGIDLVWHSPHGMRDQLRTAHYNTDVARAYRSQGAGARAIMNDWTRRHDADWGEIEGDFNIDLRALWVQAYLKTTFPGYHVNFHKPYPHRGTFRGSDEIIDLGLLRGKVEVIRGPAIGQPIKGFDHIRWTETLA